LIIYCTVILVGAAISPITLIQGLLVKAIIFAVIHQAVLSWFRLFLMGLLLGWLRNRGRSLVPCMIVHFLHNLAVIVLEFVP